MRKIAIAFPLFLLISPAIADTPPTALPYAVFEETVPHMDLASCPAALPQTDSFCRVAMGHDAAHVFAFALDGSSPMIGHDVLPLSAVAPHEE
ncbi:MAG: hypothetical protein AAFP87_06155 [Pseudomonadota bacterium]